MKSFLYLSLSVLLSVEPILAHPQFAAPGGSNGGILIPNGQCYDICKNKAAVPSPCQAADTACLCRNNQWTTQMQQCFQSSCSPKDASDSTSELSVVCQAVGTSISTVPSSSATRSAPSTLPTGINGNAPMCFATCLAKAPVVGCTDPTNIACRCGLPQFVESLAGCIVGQCPSNDQKDAEASIKNICVNNSASSTSSGGASGGGTPASTKTSISGSASEIKPQETSSASSISYSFGNTTSLPLSTNSTSGVNPDATNPLQGSSLTNSAVSTAPSTTGSATNNGFRVLVSSSFANMHCMSLLATLSVIYLA